MTIKYRQSTLFWPFLLAMWTVFALFCSTGTVWSQTPKKINWLDSASKVDRAKALGVIRSGLKSTAPFERAQLQLLQGKIFNQLAMYDSSLIALNRASASFVSLKDSTGLADSFYQIGLVQNSTGKFKESITTEQKAFVLYQKVRNNDGAVRSLISLASSSAKTKKYPQAKEYYEQALERAKLNAAYELMVEAYDGLATIAEIQKDYKRAITNIRLMHTAWDSIFIRDKRKALSMLEDRYSNKLEEKDRALIEAEAQHKRVQTDRLLRLIERDDIQLTFYSVALALIFLVLVLCVAWIITRRQAVVAEKKLRNEQKTIKLANEHYDIISQQIYYDLSHNDVNESLIANMRDMIWLINPNNKSLEGLIAYIREQMNAFLKKTGMNYMIIVPDRLPNAELTSLERVNLFVVTREIVSYLITSAKASGITISITLEGRQVVFRIKDNTPGVDEDKIKKRADELTPWRERMEQINGTIGVVAENGAIVVIYRFFNT